MLWHAEDIYIKYMYIYICTYITGGNTDQISCKTPYGQVIGIVCYSTFSMKKLDENEI